MSEKNYTTEELQAVSITALFFSLFWSLLGIYEGYYFLHALFIIHSPILAILYGAVTFWAATRTCNHQQARRSAIELLNEKDKSEHS